MNSVDQIITELADPKYWDLIKEKATSLKSDGCSGPTIPVYELACFEHDIHYRTGKTIFNAPITRSEADGLFSKRIRNLASWGFKWKDPTTWGHMIGFPMSYWRWGMVRLFGRNSYKGKNNS